ncbi:Alpha/Beta hydrolase protein [Phyllosticta citriasiana]|uniref:Alpha/Beta hydrolase protein n=1 Tax=Phyllosticta citriasiana TaxID=595635 RepID=UPI0030FD4D53
MPNQIKDIYRKDETSFRARSLQCLPSKNFGKGARPRHIRTVRQRHSYKDFHPKSFAEVNPEHRSEHSAWETPDPKFWTSHGYAVVRADERGTGQSPGLLDTMSRGTSEAFFDVVEWAAEQPWSSGKVGLLGISYFAGSQWRVAARQPKGLSAIVVTNQYGRPGRAARNWGPDTLEGDLPEEEMAKNRQDQNVDNLNNHFRDDLYYASKEYDMADIQVPLLSVGNWGGILLHLRGNVEGFVNAGSEFKYLRMITGRHDLPFYYKEEVEVQRSFLDAFLKGEDRVGWSKKGAVPPVDIVLRKGDVGFNDAAAERTFARRTENEWPIARTQWTNFYLTPDESLTPEAPASPQPYKKLSYPALGSLAKPSFISFTTAPFTAETEITGNVVAHLNVSMTADPTGPTPTDIDLFLTLRHISPAGNEVFYTGTAGDPVPLTKGWLRVSLRQTNPAHPKHRAHLPWREYTRADARAVIPGEVYGVDVEIWPTQVGSGIFLHDHPEDRSEQKLRGMNHISFGPKYTNYVTLPVIPPK